MTMHEFFPLADDISPQYEHVFNEAYWWNQPRTPIDDIKVLLAGPDAGLPTMKSASFAGSVMLGSFLQREHVQLAKVIELPAGSLFRASDYIGATLVHSVVESMHRRPQVKRTSAGQAEYEYAHTDTGFLVRRSSQTGEATYFQGRAWHMVLPARGKENPGNIAYSIIIDADVKDKMHLEAGDMRRPKSTLKTANAHAFSTQDYLSWIVGRVHTNNPPILRRSRSNETWQHRFVASSIYEAGRSYSGGNQRPRQPKKARSKFAPQLGFSS